MDFDYLKIAVTISLAVLGWIVGHYFTNKRAVASKQRDMITDHLVNSYRTLAIEISHRTISDVRNRNIEELVADIQLFGNKKQIEIIKSLVIEMAKGSDFGLDPLLNELRDDLRKRLDLEEAKGNVNWVRFSEQCPYNKCAEPDQQTSTNFVGR